MASSIVSSTFYLDGIRGINIQFTSNSDGSVNGHTVDGVYGRYLCHKITPSQNSGYIPHSVFNVKVYDLNSADLLASTGNSVTNAPPGIEWIMPWFPNSYMIYLTNENLEVNVTSLGDSKVGELEIILANEWS